MAAAPQNEPEVATLGRLGGVARVVKEHPLMLVVSILGTVATFIVGTARVTGLVLGDESSPAIAETIATDDTALPPGSGYQYTRISDESEQISVEVPTRWGNVRGNGWHARNFPKLPQDSLIGPGLNAAPNVTAWAHDLETPGVFIGASREILDAYTPEEVLGQVEFGDCATSDRKSYSNADFTGAIVTWSCDNGTLWRVLAATPTESRAYLLYVQAKLVSAADIEAYNRIVNTFEVEFAPGGQAVG